MIKTSNKKARGIILATEKLLEESGRDEITIRNVAKVAKVQSPTIYRIFKDKKGLLSAVAEYGFAKYMELDQKNSKGKTTLDELRRGWDFHVNFGCTHPQLYKLMYGEYKSVAETNNTLLAQNGFHSLVHKLAKEGCLCVSEETALFTLFTSANGAITSHEVFGDNNAIFELVRENTIQSITTKKTPGAKSVIQQSIVTLLANTDRLTQLSTNEVSLLREWLNRLKI